LLGGKDQLIQGVLKQSEAVRVAVREIEEENLSRAQDQIIEGVHLVPSLYSAAPWRLRVLLYDPDAGRLHTRMQEKFAQRPEMAAPWTEEKIAEVESIQEWLLSEASGSDVLAVEALSPEYCSAMIVAQLRRRGSLPDVRPVTV